MDLGHLTMHPASHGVTSVRVALPVYRAPPVHVSRWALTSARAIHRNSSDMHLEDLDRAVHRPAAEYAVRDRQVRAGGSGHAVTVAERHTAVTRPTTDPRKPTRCEAPKRASPNVAVARRGRGSRRPRPSRTDSPPPLTDLTETVTIRARAHQLRNKIAVRGRIPSAARQAYRDEVGPAGWRAADDRNVAQPLGLTRPESRRNQTASSLPRSFHPRAPRHHRSWRDQRSCEPLA